MNKEPDKSQRRALGKGLSALLPSRAKDESIRAKVAEQPAGAKQDIPVHFEEFQTVQLHLIEPGEGQPRDSFDEAKLDELAQSIRSHGVIQPITVYRTGVNSFRIIAGERRWRAAQRAGLTEIPVLVRSVDPGELLELALIENIQREDLNPIEIAIAFQKLSTTHGLSHEQIAEKTGKDRSTVTNFLRLLKLSPRVRNELVTGEITMGHARALLNVQDPDEQARLCDSIKDRHLSVRDTEALVRKLTQPSNKGGEGRPSADSAEPLPMDPNIRAALEEMAMALGTKVRLHARSETSGRLEIEYYSQEDLDRIYAAIVKQCDRPET